METAKGKDPQYLTSKGKKGTDRFEEFTQFRFNLLLLRATKGYALERVGELLNVRPKRIWDFESGRLPPKFDEVRAMAKLFDVTIDQLLYKKAKVTFED